jgi:hypothetical protein
MALAATPAVAVSPDPDAALIAACDRFRELTIWLNDPDRPDRARDLDELPEYAEWERLGDTLVEATPTTMAGVVALARLAAWETRDDSNTVWQCAMGCRFAHRIVLALAQIGGGA